MYDLHSFRWSESDYELREFVERFGHQLPCLISVTEGYHGNDEWIDQIPTAETSWLYAIVKQARVVLRDAKDTYYSIPESYEGRVIPVNTIGEDGAPTTLRKMLLGNNCHLKFVDQRITVHDGPEPGKINRLGQLEVVDTYSESFLVVHILSQGRLQERFAFVPVYAPIKISIALTCTAGGQKTFFTTMLWFKKFADGCHHDYTNTLEPFAQITTFDGKPDRRDYDYKTVVPLLPTKKKRSSKTDSTRKPAPEAVRDAPIAHDMSPDDRLTLLKCILYSGVIPDEDGAEGLPGLAAAHESTANQPMPLATDKKAPKPLRALIGEKIIKPLVTRFKQRKVSPSSPADTQEEEHSPPQHYEGVAPYVSSDTNYEQICINQETDVQPNSNIDGTTNTHPKIKPPIPLKPSSIRDAKESLRKTAQTQAVNSTKTQMGHSTDTQMAHFSDTKAGYFSDIKAEKLSDTKAEHFSDTKTHFSDKQTEHVHDTYQVQRHSKQTVLYENTQARYFPDTQVEHSHDTKHFTDTQAGNFTDTPQVHFTDTPQVHFSDTPKVHFTDTPQVHFSDTQEVHFTDTPQVHFSETQEVHIRSLADIPGDLSSLSVEQVAECLDLLHMSGCKDLFQYHMIDGEMLQCLDDESVLKQEFGLSSFEARKLVKFAKGYRPKIS